MSQLTAIKEKRKTEKVSLSLDKNMVSFSGKMRKCAECTTFIWHKQQFWDTWGWLIVLIRVSVSPQFAVNSLPLVSIVTEQCVGENGEKDNLPHNGKNTETSGMCSRFKMWFWRHMFIRIGWQKNYRFYQREWWTFKCCSICVVIYCVVLSGPAQSIDSQSAEVITRSGELYESVGQKSNRRETYCSSKVIWRLVARSASEEAGEMPTGP